MFEFISKFFTSLGAVMDTFHSAITILADWINLGKTVSDSSIDLIKKETEVDRAIKTKELDQLLEDRLKKAGLPTN